MRRQCMMIVLFALKVVVVVVVEASVTFIADRRGFSILWSYQQAIFNWMSRQMWTTSLPKIVLKIELIASIYAEALLNRHLNRDHLTRLRLAQFVFPIETATVVVVFCCCCTALLCNYFVLYGALFWRHIAFDLSQHVPHADLFEISNRQMTRTSILWNSADSRGSQVEINLFSMEKSLQSIKTITLCHWFGAN